MAGAFLCSQEIPGTSTLLFSSQSHLCSLLGLHIPAVPPHAGWRWLGVTLGVTGSDILCSLETSWKELGRVLMSHSFNGQWQTKPLQESQFVTIYQAAQRSADSICNASTPACPVRWLLHSLEQCCLPQMATSLTSAMSEAVKEQCGCQ